MGNRRKGVFEPLGVREVEREERKKLFMDFLRCEDSAIICVFLKETMLKIILHTFLPSFLLVYLIQASKRRFTESKVLT